MIALEVDIYRMHKFTAADTFSLACWIMIFLTSVFPLLFDRLELNAGQLRKREGFRTTKIPLAEVTLVRKYGLTTGQLVIEFEPAMPKADPKSIVVNPKDRSGFVSAMRQFAPQATFEI
jgi:hypothetical protein